MAVKLITLNPLLFQNTETGETSDNPIDIGGTAADLEEALRGNATTESNPSDDVLTDKGIFVNNPNQVEINNSNNFYNKTVDLETAVSLGKEIKRNNQTGQAVNSIFDKGNYNGFSSAKLGGVPKNSASDYDNSSSEYVENESFVNPTATKIIEKFGGSQSKNNQGYRWDYPDFIFCKNFGKITNNYLITLRRFAMPPPDDIYNHNAYFIKEDGSVQTTSLEQPPIAQACTYMGEEAGNPLKDIFKFKVGFNWKKIESELK